MSLDLLKAALHAPHKPSPPGVGSFHRRRRHRQSRDPQRDRPRKIWSTSTPYRSFHIAWSATDPLVDDILPAWRTNWMAKINLRPPRRVPCWDDYADAGVGWPPWNTLILLQCYRCPTLALAVHLVKTGQFKKAVWILHPYINATSDRPTIDHGRFLLVLEWLIYAYDGLGEKAAQLEAAREEAARKEAARKGAAQKEAAQKGDERAKKAREHYTSYITWALAKMIEVIDANIIDAEKMGPNDELDWNDASWRFAVMVSDKGIDQDIEQTTLDRLDRWLARVQALLWHPDGRYFRMDRQLKRRRIALAYLSTYPSVQQDAQKMMYYHMQRTLDEAEALEIQLLLDWADESLERASTDAAEAEDASSTASDMDRSPPPDYDACHDATSDEYESDDGTIDSSPSDGTDGCEPAEGTDGGDAVEGADRCDPSDGSATMGDDGSESTNETDNNGGSDVDIITDPNNINNDSTMASSSDASTNSTPPRGIKRTKLHEPENAECRRTMLDSQSPGDLEEKSEKQNLASSTSYDAEVRVSDENTDMPLDDKIDPPRTRMIKRLKLRYEPAADAESRQMGLDRFQDVLKEKHKQLLDNLLSINEMMSDT